MAVSRRTFLSATATSIAFGAFAARAQDSASPAETYLNEVTGYGPLVADPKMRRVIDAMTPMGRMGTAGGIAEAVVWLCSPAALLISPIGPADRLSRSKILRQAPSISLRMTSRWPP